MSPVNEAPPPIPTPKPEAPAAVLDSAVAALKAQEKPSKKRKSPTDEDTQVRIFIHFISKFVDLECNLDDHGTRR